MSDNTLKQETVDKIKLNFNIDKETRTVYVRAEGEITVDDLIENEKKIINDPDFETDLNTLADFSRAWPAVSVNYQTIEMSRHFVSSIQNLRGRSKWALIAPNDPAYGVCRMFASLSDGLSIETKVFRSEREARKWLGLDRV